MTLLHFRDWKSNSIIVYSVTNGWLAQKLNVMFILLMCGLYYRYFYKNKMPVHKRITCFNVNTDFFLEVWVDFIFKLEAYLQPNIKPFLKLNNIFSFCEFSSYISPNYDVFHVMWRSFSFRNEIITLSGYYCYRNSIYIFIFFHQVIGRHLISHDLRLMLCCNCCL